MRWGEFLSIPTSHPEFLCQGQYSLWGREAFTVSSLIHKSCSNRVTCEAGFLHLQSLLSGTLKEENLVAHLPWDGKAAETVCRRAEGASFFSFFINL